MLDFAGFLWLSWLGFRGWCAGLRRTLGDLTAYSAVLAVFAWSRPLLGTVDGGAQVFAASLSAGFVHPERSYPAPSLAEETVYVLSVLTAAVAAVLAAVAVQMALAVFRPPRAGLPPKPSLAAAGLSAAWGFAVMGMFLHWGREAAAAASLNWVDPWLSSSFWFKLFTLLIESVR